MTFRPSEIARAKTLAFNAGFVASDPSWNRAWNLALAVIAETTELAATLIDDSAQQLRKLRDPGMANHDAALARRLRNGDHLK